MRCVWGRSAALRADAQNNIHRDMLSRIAEAHRSGCVLGGSEWGGVGVGSAPLGAERWAMFVNVHNPTYRSGLERRGCVAEIWRRGWRGWRGWRRRFEGGSNIFTIDGL